MTALNPEPTATSRLTLAGIPQSAVPLVLAEIISGKDQLKSDSIIHIALGDRELDAIASVLPFFAPDAEILTLPAWDSMPYDRVSARPQIVARRVETLAALASANSAKKRILLTTINAVLQKLPPRKVMKASLFNIRPGAKLDREALLQFLAANGYRRVGKALETGEFALRGSLIDIIPPGIGQGVRLDLFGDEVESVRAFEPLSQLTTEKIPGIVFQPVSEILLNETTIEQFRNGYRDAFGAISKEDQFYEAISAGQHYPGMEHWLPLFYDHLETVFDYLPNALVTFSNQAEQTAHERHETIADYYQARVATKKTSASNGNAYLPLLPERLYLMPLAWERMLETQRVVELTPFHHESQTASLITGFRGTPSLSIQPTPDITPFDALREHATTMRQAGKSTLLACQSEGSRERLSTLLAERNFHTIRIDSWAEIKTISGKTIGLAVLPLATGFESTKLSIVSEQDLLGERIIRARPKKKQSDVFMAEAANFLEGELVVHKEHGIGRFEGLITLDVNGAQHDCLKLVYANDDKLFLPVENIELVSRYGEDESAKLDKLGGAAWQARKARMKQRIKIAAEALLKTAAERALREGEIIIPHTDLYDAFCARFPYAETEDQARAIDDVIEDLGSGRPMDRLVCGDVGFGKTEVALRAAFVAAAGPEPLQVAIVAPTTLLARQHFRNFRERFEGFGITVRQLSRMATAKEQKQTKEMLEDGRCRIVVGTHALLAKSIKFHKLGLLVVDEEQHFGVGQKEKLKELKADVHVLTLSATPIPRTLQMALSGVRELSLITTPPVDRLAVRSFVMPFDPVVLREALLREKHRSGRSFIVCPRIKDIPEMKLAITELVPEVKIAIAHGQMPASELDEIMNEFYDGKYDVLLSTAIIESGLDIPTANTMIIHHSHRFGLAQLYQLRGRVGRGKTRAYAYFLLPARKTLGVNATKRLEVMQSLDSLGAGFQLASHDMDIRGAGNLVGEEQSGHIQEVGIELYQQMLEEAIAALKTKLPGMEDAPSKDEDWSPQINLGLSVLIPETYVSDLNLRMGLYRRVASLETEADIDSFAAELVDRFGEMPEEVKHLLDVVAIKQLCKRACIERLDAGPKGAVLAFRNNAFPDPDALISHITKSRGQLKLRPDQKLFYAQEWKTSPEKIKTCRILAGGIAALI